MGNARRILIETDVLEVFSVRIGPGLVRRCFCEECGAEDQMIDLNAAVTASGIRALDLIARITAGSVHSPRTDSGHMWICLTSLKRQPEVESRIYEIAAD
jgi:hypothetical protein